MLTLILPKFFEIVSLNSNLRLEFGKFIAGDIEEEEVLQTTHEIKDDLLRKSQELSEIARMLLDGEEFTRACQELSSGIRQQATRIANGLVHPINVNEVSEGIKQTDSRLLTLESRLCSHYDEIAANKERERIVMQCYEKALHSLRKHPPPIFEEHLEEYKNVIEGADINYSEDERIELNKKMLQLPGVPSFLVSLEKTSKRNHLLNLVRTHDENDPTSISPLPEEILALLPCTKVLDFLHFSSEDDLRRDFIRFFKNGNWLEAYVFLMLERAGCSTRLLNVRISKNEVSLEADILALFKNKLFIFEVKDRSASNGLTENDITNIGNQLERMANIGSSNIETTYVINIGEEFKTATKSTIDELSSTKGVNVAVIFLENHQAVDSVVANIRGSLR